jgi:hypothetical protein
MIGSIRRSSVRRVSRSAPMPEVQYRRSATFPAQGDNCRKGRGVRRLPDWSRASANRAGGCYRDKPLITGRRKAENLRERLRGFSQNRVGPKTANSAGADWKGVDLKGAARINRSAQRRTHRPKFGRIPLWKTHDFPSPCAEHGGGDSSPHH